MKRLIRKWIVLLKRRRLRREQRKRGDHKLVAREIQEAGLGCSNCGAELTGPFCHICGQRDDDFKRPFWSLLREILDNVFSSDSRLFKTLFLLVLVPGGLTRAFTMGRRAQFVPPLRLYITVSIMFFVILAIADVLILDINVTPRPNTEEAVEARKEAVKDVQSALRDMGISDEEEEPEEAPAAPPTAEDAVEGADQEQPNALADEQGALVREKLKEALAKEGDKIPPEARKKLEEMANDPEALTVKPPSTDGPDVDFDLPYDVEVDMFVPNDDEDREGFKQEDINRVLDDPSVPDFIKDVTKGFARALQQPEAFNRLFNEWLPRALFVLLPVFALILRAFHWGKERYYLHQLVFSLHFHSFLFLLLTALIIIVPLYGSDLGAGLFWWGTSLYLIIALKVGQGQGFLRAFVKAGFIWVSYFFVMMVVIGSAVLFGLREL